MPRTQSVQWDPASMAEVFPELQKIKINKSRSQRVLILGGQSTSSYLVIYYPPNQWNLWTKGIPIFVQSWAYYWYLSVVKWTWSTLQEPQRSSCTLGQRPQRQEPWTGRHQRRRKKNHQSHSQELSSWSHQHCCPTDGSWPSPAKDPPLLGNLREWCTPGRAAFTSLFSY